MYRLDVGGLASKHNLTIADKDIGGMKSLVQLRHVPGLVKGSKKEMAPEVHDPSKVLNFFVALTVNGERANGTEPRRLDFSLRYPALNRFNTNFVFGMEDSISISNRTEQNSSRTQA